MDSDAAKNDKSKFDNAIDATKDEAGEIGKKFELFEEWLISSGSKYSKLIMKSYGNDCRGVHSNCDIPSDEIIMEIPLRCIITVEMGQATPIGRAILQTGIELEAPKHIFMMIFILTDMAKHPNDSFFKSYYDILPKNLSNFPIFWTDEELSQLTGSYLLTQIADRKQAITNDYYRIQKACQDFYRLPQICDDAEVRSLSSICPDIQTFFWARTIVCSRNFGMTIHGNKTAGLVPLADMLNHFTSPKQTAWTFDAGRNSFIITSECPLVCGDQVFDSYGSKCNHRFLLNYGFSIEENLDEECYQDSYNNQQDEKSSPNEIFLSLSHTQISKLNAAVNDTSRTFFYQLKSLVYQDDAHEYDIEIEAIKRLLDIVATSLGSYRNSLTHDTASLTDNIQFPLFSNKRNALIQVKAEKEVMAYWHNLCRFVVYLHESGVNWSESASVEYRVDQLAQDFVNCLSGESIEVFVKKSMIRDYILPILSPLAVSKQRNDGCLTTMKDVMQLTKPIIV